MSKKKYLTAQEVCFLCGISIYTLNTWYNFKKKHPRHELSKLLPKPKRTNQSDRSPRVWAREDIEKILEFKAKRPRGRNGVMGELQPKCRRKKGAKNGKRISKTNR